jgi:hypothetical protein
MEVPTSVLIVLIVVGVGALAVIVGLILALRRTSHKVNLTHAQSPGAKPEWMRTDPPAETIAATQADGEPVGLFDYDTGEHVASAFAEQVEDILNASLRANPALASLKVDFGTAPDGGLDIWVDGKRYTEVNQVPNKELRQAIRDAVQEWERHHERPK